MKGESMKTKKGASKSPPDDQIKPLNVEKEKDSPRIFNMVKRNSNNPKGRRRFIKNLAGASGITAIASIFSKCKFSEFDVLAGDDQCTCHVVCTCDSEGKDTSNYETEWKSQYYGQECTCDTVCTCNTVCTCDTVGGGGGGGGGGSHYWYPN